MSRQSDPSGPRARSAPALLALLLFACARPTIDRPYVETLTLRGFGHVNKNEVQKGLALDPTKWWDFRHHRVYDELLLDADRERVLRYFQTHGYYNAQIIVAEAKPRLDKRKVDVTIAVDEGPPTRIDDMRVTGTGTLPQATKHQIEEQQLSLRRGQTFVHARYLTVKEAFSQILKTHGFPWAELRGDVLVDRKPNTAKIEVEILPGVYSRIGTIDVFAAPPAGDPKQREMGAFQLGKVSALPVDPALLVKKLGVRPGDEFSLPKLETGRAGVLQLRLFQNVNMFYDHDPVHPDLVNVHLRVSGPSLNELRLGGGVGIESQRNEVRLSMLYTRRNFLGGLRTLQLRLRPAYVVMPAVWDPIVRQGPAITADAIFTQPDIGPFNKLTWTVGYDLGVEYAYQYHGPRTQLAVVHLFWHDRISVGGSYNFQFLDFFNTSPQILTDASNAGGKYGYTDPYRIAWLQQDVTLDLRDDRAEPHKGFFAETSLEEGGEYVGGAFYYEKIRVGARAYAPLGSRVVLAGRAEFGQMWTHGTDSSPITRRLYLGGANSQRGFTEGRLSPQVAVPGGSPLPVGGDQSFLVSGELRIDIVRLLGNMLGGAVFCDAGDVGRAKGDNVTGWHYGVDFAHLHTAVGGGLRYRTPIGTVRGDVGVRLNRVSAFSDGQPNPDPGQRVAVHISLAEAF